MKTYKKPSESEFLDYLAEALNEDPKKTKIIDMDQELKRPTEKILDPSEEYQKRLSEQMEKRKKYFPEPAKDQIALYKKIQEMSSEPTLKMSPEKPPFTSIEDIIQQADPTNKEDMIMVEKLKALQAGKGSGRTAKDLPQSPQFLKEAPEVMDKVQKAGKFKRILGALGKRGAKAVPYVGTGLGLLAAKEALAKGDKVGAALETASAVDPTPLSDIALAGKDVYDILSEDNDLGEQESPDVELGDNKFNYKNELEKRKKLMGYK
jgi:hypothetical protein